MRRRLGRFLRARGLGHTLTVLSILASSAGTFAMVTKTVWQLPSLSNALWAIAAACVMCVVGCYATWPRGETSNEGTTEIQTDPAPDPTAQGKGRGNTEDTGPTIVVPRGSKTKVPRDATVWFEDPEEKGNGGERSKAEDDSPSS